MMHDRADTIDAFPGVGGVAIPNAPVQSLNLRDDHCLRHYAWWIVGRQRIGDLFQVLKSHSDMEPVQDRRIVDAGIDENTSKAWTTVGKGGQRGVLRSANGVEVPADQHRGVRFGSGDGAENLARASLRFNIANSYLQMTFSVLATSNEGGIQSDRDCRRLRFRLDRGTITKCRAGPQGMAAHRFLVFADANREHLL